MRRSRKSVSSSNSDRRSSVGLTGCTFTMKISLEKTEACMRPIDHGTLQPNEWIFLYINTNFILLLVVDLKFDDDDGEINL